MLPVSSMAFQGSCERKECTIFQKDKKERREGGGTAVSTVGTFYSFILFFYHVNSIRPTQVSARLNDAISFSNQIFVLSFHFGQVGLGI